MDNRVTTYQRLLRSAQAEQILSNAKICLDIPKLRPHIIGEGVDKTSELYRYMKFASQNGSFISTEYSSKGKVTARMFTKKGSLNLITLSDERILSAIRSRYQNGYILCLDYKNFEPSIIKSELGDVMPENIHDWTCEIMPWVARGDAKKNNMWVLYSIDPIAVIGNVRESVEGLEGYDEESFYVWAKKMITIREYVDDYISTKVDDFKSGGIIVNSYGRKIAPKSEATIFNNTIQSIGSEILVEAIINLQDFLRGKEAHLLFHRFDSLYIDVSKKALFTNLKGIRDIMEGVNKGVDLKVGIEVGKNLATLKEIDIG